MSRTYQRAGGKAEPKDLPGYPDYSKGEDIYTNAKEEDEIDPENFYRTKDSIYEDETEAESGVNLDVQASELDDDLEDVGSEDEENNYYSLSDNDDLEDLI